MFSYGNNAFPIAPTSYSSPQLKEMDINYAVDGTMIPSVSPWNENELTLVWENVINDANNIVIWLKNFIRKEIKRNKEDKEPKTLRDGGIGLYSGPATLISSSMSIRKIGPSIAYTFSLTFKLR